MTTPSPSDAGPWWREVTRYQWLVLTLASAASGIFHASSVLGTLLATAAGTFVVAGDRANGWRYGFLLGVLPALLVFAVRAGMQEPKTWQHAREQARAGGGLGRFTDLFATE